MGRYNKVSIKNRKLRDKESVFIAGRFQWSYKNYCSRF